jgi:hypothetical protein
MIRHDTPRCEDHIPPEILEAAIRNPPPTKPTVDKCEDEEEPVTPRPGGLFGTMGFWGEDINEQKI